MMLARIALRIATIEALKGSTLVGDNVLDSQIGVIDIAADDSLRTDQESPFISVYVDGSKLEDRIDQRSLHKSGPTELTIETGITAAMTETDDETGVSTVVGIGIPSTDPALEFYLDCVGKQITTALSDPSNAWAEIWRCLSSSVLKIERKRTSDATSGMRIAAHQLIITLDLLPDPVFGEPLSSTSIWSLFFARLAEPTVPNPDHDSEDPESSALIVEPTLAAKTTMLRSLIGAPDGVLNHEALRRRFGLTLDEARALFDIAVEPGEPTEPKVASLQIEHER